jgi:transposase
LNSNKLLDRKLSASYVIRLRETLWISRRIAEVGLIQDNASFHKKPGVLEFFAKHSRQIEVFSLPPYSPDFNATERLWHYTRKESTHNRYFDRPAALCQSLFATFADMQRHPEKIYGLLVPFF